MACAHSIKVTSDYDEKPLNHSIALIKGYIEGEKLCTSQLTLEHSHNKTQNWPIRGNRFRIIVSLENGKNVIKLKYCKYEKTLVLCYELEDTKYVVTPIYIICDGHSGNFQSPANNNNSVESACKRIMVGCKLIQTILAEKLHEKGFGRKVFKLESENCLIFHSKLHVEDGIQMQPLQLWEYFGREIMISNIGSNHRKFLAFLSCFDGMDTYTHVALGGGGLALFGAVCLYTWPDSIENVYQCFENNSLLQPKYYVPKLAQRNTYGEYFSSTLGAVCHELAHTFDLGHTRNGIMGQEFHNVASMFLIDHNNSKNSRLTRKSEKFTPIFNVKCEIRNCSMINGKQKESFTKLQSNEEDENDDLYLSNGCAVILAYHRWFQTGAKIEADCLKFDEQRGIIWSKEGIVVIQLRNENGYILRSWQFSPIPKKTLFLVPVREIKKSNCIFIQDLNGNNLKSELQKIH